MESGTIKDSLSLLRKDHRASMCMLGNSIFTNACEDEVKDILGNVEIAACISSPDGPRIIRKA
ncbi:MAG: pantothenate kinase, partial [Methanomassiliicoccaceae archaeon]|nr:pantothenate kinase [Methanomassiliicoccaceae archaeon]